MINDLIIRRAEIKDIEFIIKGIIESEKSGTARLSYSGIFFLSESNVKEIFGDILKENIPGQQFCLSNFLIAETGNEYAGTCCSWIEGETGIASSIIRASLLLDFIDSNNIEATKYRLKIAAEVNIPRENGTIQIENVFVEEKFRGKGISGMLIQKHIELQKPAANVPKVQIILSKTNENAFRSYLKSGFKIVEERTSDNREILEFLPSDTNILMEKELE